MPYYMPSYESKKSCAYQAIFLGPVVGGGRVAGSTMHLQLILSGGRTVVPSSSSVNQPLRVACGGPARGWTRRVASSLAAASIRLWQDGRQP